MDFLGVNRSCGAAAIDFAFGIPGRLAPVDESPAGETFGTFELIGLALKEESFRMV